jgi:hypothetical protein
MRTTVWRNVVCHCARKYIQAFACIGTHAGLSWEFAFTPRVSWHGDFGVSNGHPWQRQPLAVLLAAKPTISALSAKLTSDYTVCTEAGTRGVGNEAMVLKRTNEQMTHAWNWWRTKDGARVMPDFHPIRGVMHLQRGLIWSSRDA